MVVYEPRPGVNPAVKILLGVGVAAVAAVLVVLTLRATIFAPATTWPPDHPCYYVAGYVKSVEDLTKRANEELDRLSNRLARGRPYRSTRSRPPRRFFGAWR